MEMLWIALPISLALIVFAGCVFYWAVSKRQFDNLDYEAQRILFERDKHDV